jgi:cytochrome c556
VMHERHEGMEDIGKAMKAAGRTMQSGSPDLEVLKKSAATINSLAPKASGWFPAGTGPDAGKTHALPAVWEKPDEFSARMRDMQAAAPAFHAAAQSGDMNRIKPAMATLGKSCKACHDTFREEEHD